MTREHYFNIFKVSIADMDKVLAKALRHGAPYADLYFESTSYRDILLRDGVVSSGGFHIDYGVGIRVLDGDRTGYSYCENTDMADMLRAADAAGSISLCGNSTLRPADTPATHGEQEYYRMLQSWDDAPADILAATLTRIDTTLRAADTRISKVIAKISASESDIMMYNSHGELCCDSRPMGSLMASIIFSDGKTNETRSASRSFRMGAEMLDESIVNELIEEILHGIDPMLEAGRPKGGNMSVVMGAGASGILLHEAMGHAFEADFNRKGQSIFCDKMGSRICPKGINVVDDGTWTANRGACNYDDEGVRGQKTYMVEDGVLASFLHDRISAAHYGVAPTGNGRRESFRYNPIPRMRLTYMESGSTAPEDIIASVRKGIYVDEFSNGQVKIGEGDFTFYVKCGYLIENGRLTRPIKDINVIGNGPRALADTSMVGNDLKIDNGTWTCGKDQSVPVGCGMPTVLVNNLTVGGDDDE